MIKNFFIYLLGALLLGGFHIILAPLNMRMLTPHDYGILALITSSMAIGTALLGFGLRQFLSIEYFHHDEHGQKKIVNHILVIYAALALPICLILLVLQKPILHFFAIHHISPLIFSATLITTFLSFFAELFYQLLKYQQRAWKLMLIQTSIALCALSITVGLLLWANLGIMSTVIGQMVSMGAATGVGFYVWRQEKFGDYFELRPPKGTALRYLKYGFPFVPGILFSWIIASSDRFLLAHYAGMHEVGIYAIADMFGAMFRLLILQSWSGSYLPHILTQYQHNKHDLLTIERKNLFTMWITLAGLMLLMLGGFWIAKPLILIILPTNYHKALHYIMIILAGHIFLLGSYFAASFIQFHKKTYFLAASFCIPALLNIIFNILLIPHYKIYGCTIATMAAYGIYFVIILWYNKRLQRGI